MKKRSLPLALLLLAALASRPAAAETPQDPDALLAAVGTPASERAVRAALDDRRFEEPAQALRLAATLRVSGGVAAADGLRRLVASRHPEVRRAALEGLAELGLRSREVVRDVRKAADDPDATVRLAVIGALGRVGDGRDVEGLLAGLSSEKGEVRSASLRALRSLSGALLTASPVRWTQWWSKVEPKGRQDLEDALHAVSEAEDEDTDLEGPRNTIASLGWIDVEAVEAAARDWMRSTRPLARLEGFRAVTALRLAGLAEVVRSESRFRRSDADEWAALDAARQLGIEALGASPTERGSG
jgi:hypothetical protein